MEIATQPLKSDPGRRPIRPPYEESILFASPLVKVGAFRCRPQYPRFSDTGPIQNHILVFPRTPVLISHHDGPTIVADPCTVMFYNRGQVYRRGELCEQGDVCEWFAFDHELLCEALRPYDRRVEDRTERPFSLTHGPTDSRSYYRQRRLVEALERGVLVDPLLVEETMVGVLQRAASQAFERRAFEPRRRRAATLCAHRDLVEDVKVLLAARYTESLRLDDIARLVHSSPFHLGRVFRSATGTTLHGYRDQMRLRSSLEQVLDGCDNLSRLAHDLGYSSHSHFTAAFRRAFGVPPSAAREIA